MSAERQNDNRYVNVQYDQERVSMFATHTFCFRGAYTHRETQLSVFLEQMVMHHAFIPKRTNSTMSYD
jgi:hypothetical protein